MLKVSSIISRSQEIKKTILFIILVYFNNPCAVQGLSAKKYFHLFS